MSLSRSPDGYAPIVGDEAHTRDDPQLRLQFSCGPPPPMTQMKHDGAEVLDNTPPCGTSAGSGFGAASSAPRNDHHNSEFPRFREMLRHLRTTSESASVGRSAPGHEDGDLSFDDEHPCGGVGLYGGREYSHDGVTQVIPPSPFSSACFHARHGGIAWPLQQGAGGGPQPHHGTHSHDVAATFDIPTVQTPESEPSSASIAHTNLTLTGGQLPNFSLGSAVVHGTPANFIGITQVVVPQHGSHGLGTRSYAAHLSIDSAACASSATFSTPSSATDALSRTLQTMPSQGAATVEVHRNVVDVLPLGSSDDSRLTQLSPAASATRAEIHAAGHHERPTVPSDSTTASSNSDAGASSELVANRERHHWLLRRAMDELMRTDHCPTQASHESDTSATTAAMTSTET